MLNFIEGSCIFNYERDLFSEENSMSIDSAFSQSDVKEAFKDICMGNMNKSIFVHLNIYSLRNKSDLLKKKRGSIYILMVSEKKLDDSLH